MKIFYIKLYSFELSPLNKAAIKECEEKAKATLEEFYSLMYTDRDKN